MWQQAAQLGKAAVPDRLTEVIPDWLVAAVRPKPAPVPWADMIRAAVAICVPLSAGILAGQRATGLLAAMGGLLGVVVDNGGPFPLRIKRVGSAAVLGGAVGLTIGSLIHGRGWIAVGALVVVAGVSALLSAISDIASVTGLQLLVYSSLGLGALGAVRPWWHTALGLLLGTAWALLLTVPGWLLSPRAAERRSVAAVYHALAGHLRAIGTPGYAESRRDETAALNAAYDTLLTARATAGGQNEVRARLTALLNQANVINEAVAALSLEGAPPPQVIDAVDQVGDAITSGARPPAIPLVPGTSPGLLALRNALNGLACTLLGNWAPPDASPAPRSPRDRLAELSDRLTSRLTRTFTLRLMACIGVAGLLTEVLPLQRSYWVVLTVAIVLKPDFGSVFIRAVQRGIGTVVGAVLGAVILVLVPYGLWLLLPFAVLAALLPFGRSRNFGLQATFLTPLVVLLIDLLAPGGWHLALDRLLDTLLGCAVVLLVGYAPWPTSWQAHLPAQFAGTIRHVCQYMQEALVTAWSDRQGPAAGAQGGNLARPRRQVYRALADLRTEFERTMSEPPAISRRASAWWPAAVGLEEVTDAVTAMAAAISHGAPAPGPEAVRQLTAALGAVADAVEADAVRAPAAPPGELDLPSDEQLKPVTEAVRAVLGVLSSRPQPPAPSRPEPAPTGTRS
jgi:uncharacterized membrane protein YccC